MNFNRSVPQLIKERIEQSNYPRKEFLFCLIDLIYRKYTSNNHKHYSDYVEISSKIFLDTAGRDYLKDLNWLIEEGIVERNDFFSKDRATAKSYRIRKEFLSKVVSLE